MSHKICNARFPCERMPSQDWKQNNLPSLTFVLTPKWTILCLTAICILFLPLGISFYVNNSGVCSFVLTRFQINEIGMDYTNCAQNAPLAYTPSPTVNVDWKYSPATRNCTLKFNITNPLESTVYMYIRLSNFYQNHRLYLTSLNAPQLKGSVISTASGLESASTETSCAWLTYANCDTASKFTWTSGNGMSFASSNPDCLPPIASRASVIQNANTQAQYYPCGLVANSMFSGISVVKVILQMNFLI